MRILKSHNDYKCKDQITGAIEYLEEANKEPDFVHGYRYDALMVEADIVYRFGKVRLSHGDFPFPWRFFGTLEEYVIKAAEMGIEYVQIEYKDNCRSCIDEALYMMRKYSSIHFVWCYTSPNLSDAMKRTIYSTELLSKIQSYDSFYSQNKIDSVDLYQEKWQEKLYQKLRKFLHLSILNKENAVKFIFIIWSLSAVGCSNPAEVNRQVNINVTKVCVEGHEYYASSGYASNYSLAIELTDDGKPVKCDY